MAGANTVEVYIKLIDQASAGMKNVEKATKKTTGAMGDLKKIVATIGLGILAKQAGQFMFEATKLAARVETLGVVTQTLGRNAGYSSQQIKEFERAIQDQGITTEASRQSLAKMMQAQLDLADSTDLARLAQDAAVIAGVDSSEAFQRLINVISTGNVRMARTMGLQVNFNKGYEKMAAELGKTTDELTAQEKTQSRSNSVLGQGVQIAGAYTSAMDSVGKQLTSTKRYWDEYRVAVGKASVEELGWLNRVAQKTLDAMADELNAVSAINEARRYGIITDEEYRQMQHDMKTGTMEYTGALEDLTEQMDDYHQNIIDSNPEVQKMIGLQDAAALAAKRLGESTVESTEIGLKALKEFSTKSLQYAGFDKLVEAFTADDGVIDVKERGLLKQYSNFYEVEWPEGLDEMIANLRLAEGDADNIIGDMIGNFQSAEGPHDITFQLNFVSGGFTVPGGGGTSTTSSWADNRKGKTGGRGDRGPGGGGADSGSGGDSAAGLGDLADVLSQLPTADDLQQAVQTAVEFAVL